MLQDLLDYVLPQKYVTKIMDNLKTKSRIKLNWFSYDEMKMNLLGAI